MSRSQVDDWGGTAMTDQTRVEAVAGPLYEHLRDQVDDETARAGGSQARAALLNTQQCRRLSASVPA